MPRSTRIVPLVGAIMAAVTLTASFAIGAPLLRSHQAAALPQLAGSTQETSAFNTVGRMRSTATGARTIPTAKRLLAGSPHALPREADAPGPAPLATLTLHATAGPYGARLLLFVDPQGQSYAVVDGDPNNPGYTSGYLGVDQKGTGPDGLEAVGCTGGNYDPRKGGRDLLAHIANGQKTGKCAICTPEGCYRATPLVAIAREDGRL